MERVILGIDTATRRPSIALAGAAAAAVRRLQEGAWHARALLPAIEALLDERGLSKNALAGIGAAAGPGSFTGVRIGLATAKGLGFALDIPVVGVSTLEAIARAVAPGIGAHGTVVCPVVEAGRGEIYGALFSIGPTSVDRIDADALWRPEDLAGRLPRGTVASGDGVAALRSAGARVKTVETPELAPAIAAQVRVLEPDGKGYRPGCATPNYVRPADAEASRKRT
jgi:tRNA threonylcarbamoyladenosine biosynthesis protein TsaB